MHADEEFYFVFYIILHIVKFLFYSFCNYYNMESFILTVGKCIIILPSCYLLQKCFFIEHSYKQFKAYLIVILKVI